MYIYLNNEKISVKPEQTILDAARQVRIDIPTLCHLEGYPHYTSCMLCIVYEKNSKRLIPACSSVVQDEMDIETDSDLIRETRRDALNLLLSEHIGDCEAPCRRACPAFMDIPLMLRQIANMEFSDALITVKKHIALPAVLGRICPAPCEKVCNRSKYDEPVSICMLKRFVADKNLEMNPFIPKKEPDTGKNVAIVGSGPTGLSAAYYLLQMGHQCTLYDDHGHPGGMLRYGVPEENLSRDVLNAEINIVSELGARFKTNTRIPRDISFEKLNNLYDGVILAMGKIDPSEYTDLGLDLGKRGFKVNAKTFVTNQPGVFAGGSSVSPSKLAVRSVAHGRTIAHSVDQYFQNKSIIGVDNRFDSRVGKMQKEEINQYMQGVKATQRTKLTKNGFTDSQAIEESLRCMNCDCRKTDTCALRRYAEDYNADQKQYKSFDRKPIERILQHSKIIYEPGKCIKCGICIRITEKNKEALGLTFIRRGFDVRVAVPFNESLVKGLDKTASKCVDECPTGALSYRVIKR